MSTPLSFQDAIPAGFAGPRRGSNPGGGPGQKDMRTREQKREGLVRESLAGQNVPVMPLTMVVRDSAVSDSVLLLARPAVMAWADSILADALTLRGPRDLLGLWRRAGPRGATRRGDDPRAGQDGPGDPALREDEDRARSDPRRISGSSPGWPAARYIFVPGRRCGSIAIPPGRSSRRSPPCSPTPGRAR